MNHSEIMKAAHRQARRMEFVGGASYAVRLSLAMREMYAFAKSPTVLNRGFHSVVRDGMGVPVGAH